MAIFEFNGNTYFQANGKWVDANSKKVQPDLASQLDLAFSQKEIIAREEAQKEQQKKKLQQAGATAWNKNRWKNDAKKGKAQHQKARQEVKSSSFELTVDQRKALRVLESGENVFLSGEAGTGKSFVLNEFISRNQKKNIIVCAPTGIAAIKVGGSTLHRVFDVPIGVVRPGEYNAKPSEAVIKADILIIDEISMCRFDVFEYIIRTIRRAEEIQQNKANTEAFEQGQAPQLKPQKQIIVVGDFYQLPPVITSMNREVMHSYWDMGIVKEGFAFQSEVWAELHFKNVVLKEIIRQKGEKAFIEHLNMIRVGNPEGVTWFNQNVEREPLENSIYLCGKNSVADEINYRKSKELETESETYHASIKGQVVDSDKMTQDDLELKVGMQVMTLVNNTEEGYQNGSIGEIIKLKSESVEVRLENGDIVNVKQHDWEVLGYEVQDEQLEKVVLGNFSQIPLKIAYAITIHKSQGQTYSSANISPDCFAPGQLYVALSRVTSIEGMSLAHSIYRSALRTSHAVKEFYRGLDEVVL